MILSCFFVVLLPDRLVSRAFIPVRKGMTLWP